MQNSYFWMSTKYWAVPSRISGSSWTSCFYHYVLSWVLVNCWDLRPSFLLWDMITALAVCGFWFLHLKFKLAVGCWSSLWLLMLECMWCGCSVDPPGQKAYLCAVCEGWRVKTENDFQIVIFSVLKVRGLWARGRAVLYRLENQPNVLSEKSDLLLLVKSRLLRNSKGYHALQFCGLLPGVFLTY